MYCALILTKKNIYIDSRAIIKKINKKKTGQGPLAAGHDHRRRRLCRVSS